MSETSRTENEHVKMIPPSALKKKLSPHLYKGIFSPSKTVSSTSKKIHHGHFNSMGTQFSSRSTYTLKSVNYAVYHENQVEKRLASQSPNRLRSPKRDPILQNNNEETVQFKPHVKRLPASDRVAYLTEGDQPLFTGKKRGECNRDFLNLQNKDKPQGIRTIFTSPTRNSNEEIRRQLKPVVRYQAYSNPITEGDPKSCYAPKPRITDQQISEETKMFNDKKYLLSADRGTSPKGRVDQNINLYTSYDGNQSQFTSARPSTAYDEKIRGCIKGVIQYDNALPYRDEKLGVIKCNQLPFKEVASVRDEHCNMFARKVAVWD